MGRAKAAGIVQALAGAFDLPDDDLELDQQALAAQKRFNPANAPVSGPEAGGRKRKAADKQGAGGKAGGKAGKGAAAGINLSLRPSPGAAHAANAGAPEAPSLSLNLGGAGSRGAGTRLGASFLGTSTGSLQAGARRAGAVQDGPANIEELKSLASSLIQKLHTAVDEGFKSQAQGVVKAQEDNVARMAKEHHARVSEMLESADAAIKQARENHELARAEVRKAKDTEVAAAEKLADLQQSVQEVTKGADAELARLRKKYKLG